MSLNMLAGDIGGTKTIVRPVNAEVSSPGCAIPLMTTLREQTYVSKNFADLVPIVHEFFKEAAKASVNIPSVASACFGIAGAVVHNASELANLSWTLSGERLQRALEILRVTLINDFAAIGYGIAGLRDEQLATLQAGTPDAAAGGFHEGLFQQGRACAP